MTPKSPASYRVTVRLWVMLSLAMAVAATASTLALLYLQRPFLASRGGVAPELPTVLFAGAIATGLVAALVGLGIGVVLSRRIWTLVARTDAATGAPGDGAAASSTDELDALGAAVGRLTLSMDQFVTDSDILARLPAAMLVTDAKGHLQSFNATAEKLLDLPLGRYRGTPLLGDAGALPLAGDNGALESLLSRPETAGLTHREDVPVTTAAGKRLLLEVTIQTPTASRQSAGAILLLRDASEKRRIREQIRKADQLALLGGMAARVAHEVRTPLAAVRGLVELLQDDVASNGSGKRYIPRILDALNRQEQLVHKLLTLTHPEPESSQAVAMRSLLGELIATWPGVRPVLTLERPSAAVNGDPTLLTEVFTNLIQNALEAMGDREVTVRVGGDDAVVRVTVSNYGAGIPDDLRGRIFEPFFTTKARGTGLGLAIARQLVEAHRGTLRVESDGRTETHFIVELPATRLPEGALVHA